MTGKKNGIDEKLSLMDYLFNSPCKSSVFVKQLRQEAFAYLANANLSASIVLQSDILLL